MKIVHMCLASFYPDHYSYQENMLPKFHKLQGHDVEVLASLVSFDSKGKQVLLKNAGTYINEYGIQVTRLNYKEPLKLYKRLRRYSGTKEALEKMAPDVLFIHGCQFLDIDIVAKYAKTHPDLKIFVDNHADFANSASNWLSKNILHKIIWKHCAHIINPYTEKFYGVLPARVDFLKNVYGLPEEKCELLVIGADDELVKEAAAPDVRRRIREKYQIAKDDFLIVTGGKINKNRPETLHLMQAVNKISDPHVKLLIFGNVSAELKDDFEKSAASANIIYIGWIKSEESYPLFAAGDLVVFPGLHSVMWEQAAAQGKPCVFKKIEGFDHVDLGGNAVFLENSSAQEIEDVLRSLINDPAKILKMKEAAEQYGMKTFSYNDIAKRGIESKQH
ncbi:MAG: glycosyltransferase family 4 protein [Clostridia bacterium]|nr:glycosyltransferase family 4 protein [Clostridia bacterium]